MTLEEHAVDSVVPPAARQRPGAAGRSAGRPAGQAVSHTSSQSGEHPASHGSSRTAPAVTVIREGRRKPSPVTEGGYVLLCPPPLGVRSRLVRPMEAGVDRLRREESGSLVAVAEVAGGRYSEQAAERAATLVQLTDP